MPTLDQVGNMYFKTFTLSTIACDPYWDGDEELWKSDSFCPTTQTPWHQNYAYDIRVRNDNTSASNNWKLENDS